MPWGPVSWPLFVFERVTTKNAKIMFKCFVFSQVDIVHACQVILGHFAHDEQNLDTRRGWVRSAAIWLKSDERGSGGVRCWGSAGRGACRVAA